MFTRDPATKTRYWETPPMKTKKKRRGTHAKKRLSKAAQQRIRNAERRKAAWASKEKKSLGRVQKYVYTQTNGGAWFKTPVYSGGRLAEYPYKLSNTKWKPAKSSDPLWRGKMRKKSLPKRAVAKARKLGKHAKRHIKKALTRKKNTRLKLKLCPKCRKHHVPRCDKCGSKRDLRSWHGPCGKCAFGKTKRTSRDTDDPHQHRIAYEAGKQFGRKHFPRGQGSGSKSSYGLLRERLSVMRAGGHKDLAREYQRGVEDAVHSPRSSGKRRSRS